MVVCYTVVFRVVTGEERCVTTLKTTVQQTRRMGIEVAQRVMVQVRFCSHFSFSRSPLHVVVTSPSTPSP